MNIVWSPEALEDVEAAVDYLATRNPTAATKLVAHILGLIDRLAVELAKAVPHRQRYSETR